MTHRGDTNYFLCAAVKKQKIVKDENGHVKELHTIQMEKVLGDEGFYYYKELPGTERVWPAQHVFVAIGFEGVKKSLPEKFGVEVVRNRIHASLKNFETNVPGVFAAGDARRGQSIVVWAIKEGRAVAASVDVEETSEAFKNLYNTFLFFNMGNRYFRFEYIIVV